MPVIFHQVWHLDGHETEAEVEGLEVLVTRINWTMQYEFTLYEGNDTIYIIVPLECWSTDSLHRYFGIKTQLNVCSFYWQGQKLAVAHK